MLGHRGWQDLWSIGGERSGHAAAVELVALVVADEQLRGGWRAAREAEDRVDGAGQQAANGHVEGRACERVGVGPQRIVRGQRGLQQFAQLAGPQALRERG